MDWTAHDGSDTLPVPPDTRIAVRFRRGNEYITTAALVAPWKHEGLPSDIVAWRLASLDEPNNLPVDSGPLPGNAGP